MRQWFLPLFVSLCLHSVLAVALIHLPSPAPEIVQPQRLTVRLEAAPTPAPSRAEAAAPWKRTTESVSLPQQELQSSPVEPKPLPKPELKPIPKSKPEPKPEPRPEPQPQPKPKPQPKVQPPATASPPSPSSAPSSQVLPSLQKKTGTSAPAEGEDKEGDMSAEGAFQGASSPTSIVSAQAGDIPA